MTDAPQAPGPGTLRGRRAIVTGGASGIGLAVCRRLAAEGATVVMLDCDRELGERVAEANHLAGFVAADVSSLAAVTEAVDEAASTLGGVDTLVNNAGISIEVGIEAMNEDEWDRQLAVNLKGVFATTKAALAYLEADGGAIVNVASDVGLMGEGGGPDAYVASKHGVVGLTRSLALTWGPRGIRVNAVCPGTVTTPMTESFLGGLSSKQRQEVMSEIPLGRFAEPSEIAAAVAFLASDDASYANGAMLSVDGGTTAGIFRGPDPDR